MEAAPARYRTDVNITETQEKNVITKKDQPDGTTRITFAVDDDRPASVVGDFNSWDPLAHPLVRRSNGCRSIAVIVPTGASVCFRYLADGGEFYDDPHADFTESNGMDGSHCVVTTGPATLS